MLWYCKYCEKTIREERKKKHQELESHKMKARWHKYFSEMDRMMECLKRDYNAGGMSVDEFNETELKIYTEFDKAHDDGYFDRIPDEE